MYLKSYITAKLQIPKLPFSITLVYFIIQFITCVFWAVWLRYECHSLRISTATNIVSTTLYSTQTLILLGLLFYRLYQTYHNVPFVALSKFSIIAFIVCYGATCVIFLTGTTLFILDPTGNGGPLWSMSSIGNIFYQYHYLVHIFIKCIQLQKYQKMRIY